MITTFQELIDFIGTNLELACKKIPELERAKLLSDITYETANFALQVAPATSAHKNWLASDLMRRLRGFKAPFFVVSREMGTAEELQAAFTDFLARTEGWNESRH